MTAAHAVSLDRTGRHAIASHTVHHSRLTAIDREDCRDELMASRAALERLVQRPVRTFAFPFGAHDPTSEAAVLAAGYEIAVTTRPSRVTTDAPLLTLPRFDVGARPSADFGEWVTGLRAARA